MSHYVLRCRGCGKVLEGSFCAFCEHCKGSLVITEYKDPFREDKLKEGLWRFNWLPVHGMNFKADSTVIYPSEGLAKILGLRNLYIAFSGYWPEKGAYLKTCTFKEMEVATVLQNSIENRIEGLVVASAGNTARSFAYFSVNTGYPVIIVVPIACLKEMWYVHEGGNPPTLVVVDGDYSDAIDLAKRVSDVTGIPSEGGVKNPAKRDGLGAVLLETVSYLGRLPDHYFQAVGSGAGAIGVFETAERFLKDGRFGTRLPRFHLAQNLPFAPMFRAWKRDSRQMLPEDLDPSLIEKITTRVLSSRYPAYSIIGGVYDLLKKTGGEMYGVTNEEIYSAMRLFFDFEGIDIVPAGGAAVAGLLQAVKEKKVNSEDLILLHITGGGEERYKKEFKTYPVEPIFISKKAEKREIEEALCRPAKKG